jgi:hypothetical protein
MSLEEMNHAISNGGDIEVVNTVISRGWICYSVIYEGKRIFVRVKKI